MTKSTLIFLCKDNQVCLGRKKTGHGLGKWNGFGGHVETGETSEHAAIRELFEETGIKVSSKDLLRSAKLNYKEQSEWVVDVFVVNVKEEPLPTDEMEPEWFDMNEIPWQEMWPNDKLWLERVLKGEKFEATFWHDQSGNLLKHEFAVLKEE